ncbi:MAG TPA: sigma-70 family RNA polymerase sigma factor [Bryobacteraceae bacterium]|nr:sigma-70 family RNA polymerase sigma factor [Bryobacteraceae bacterium]
MRKEDQDAADVARVIAGDLCGFEAIVERWQHRLVSLAWRFCRDRATAEDMAQEVFVKVFRSLASFRGDSTFSTWLISVAVNTFRSRIRAEGQPLPDVDLNRLWDTTPSPLHELEERQRAEALRRAVLTLPERYRDAILVYYFEEKDMAESIRVLGVAEGTLKARLHRGRELLRRRCANLNPRAESAFEEAQ